MALYRQVIRLKLEFLSASLFTILNQQVIILNYNIGPQ